MAKITDSASIQTAYNNVASAGVDSSTSQINTAMGNNVMNQGDALNTLLGKNGIDTSSNSKAGKLLETDYTAINAATQGNDASAYAKATAQLASDLSKLTGNSVTRSSGGLDTTSVSTPADESTEVADYKQRVAEDGQR